jgi:hypothetical protein
MEITGRIIQKLDLQEGTSGRGPWKKQEFIIETNDKFPKKVCISAWAEKVDDLDRFSVNEDVKVSVNVESREYNGKWYTDVRSWKIENAGSSSGSPAPSNDNVSQEPPVFDNNKNNNNNDSSDDMSDDLPF